MLRLLNDNTALTPDSFRNGFLCLPNLHSLEIRHAPTVIPEPFITLFHEKSSLFMPMFLVQLLRYTLYAQKEQWNPLLTNVEISKD